MRSLWWTPRFGEAVIGCIPCSTFMVSSKESGWQLRADIKKAGKIEEYLFVLYCPVVKKYATSRLGPSVTMRRRVTSCRFRSLLTTSCIPIRSQTDNTRDVYNKPSMVKFAGQPKFKITITCSEVMIEVVIRISRLLFDCFSMKLNHTTIKHNFIVNFCINWTWHQS